MQGPATEPAESMPITIPDSRPRRPGGALSVTQDIDAVQIEPLARPDCNFVNTLAEAAEIARRIGNPALRIMVDTLAASLMEADPVADVIRRWMPTGLLAHIQFNDRNRRGPGQGGDKFAPVLRALRETGYGGWIAMEPFVYEPDGPTCAARMIGYVAGLLESSS